MNVSVTCTFLFARARASRAAARALAARTSMISPQGKTMKRNAMTLATCLSLSSLSHGLIQEADRISITGQEYSDTRQLNLAISENKSNSSPFSASHAIESSGDQALASHRLLKYLVVEARIGSVGEYRAEDGFDPIQAEFATYTGNAIGVLPFGESGFELFGQLGAGLVANRMDSTFATDDASSPVGTFGMGIRYTKSASSPLSLIAGYDAYHFQASGNDIEPDSELLVSKTSVGLLYDF